MHPDDIARENFLSGAHTQAFKNLSDYDIVEVRNRATKRAAERA
jgi:hypothetical protein